MSSRRTLIVIVAVVIGAIASFALFKYTDGAEDRAYEGTRRVAVIVVKKDIPKSTNGAMAVQQGYVEEALIPQEFRPATAITLADVIRAIDGPLANVHDTSLAALSYPGPAEHLREVWMAVRTSLRSVLEVVSLADLAKGELPPRVQALAAEYEADVRTYQT